ncbi:MAG: hypothetical protein V4713_14085 [Pseudomonadota bacterium]
MNAPKYLTPLDAILAMRVLDLDERQRQWFEDRCAMREIHFGLSRRKAEGIAWYDLQRHLHLNPDVPLLTA